MFKAFWSALLQVCTVFQEEYSKSWGAKIVKVASIISAVVGAFFVLPGNPIPTWSWPWRIATASVGLLVLSIAVLVALYRRSSRLVVPVNQRYLKTIGQAVLTTEQDKDGIFGESPNGDLQIATVKIVNTLHDKSAPLIGLKSVGVILFYREIGGSDWIDIARGGWLGTDHCFLDFLIGRPENLMLGIKKDKRFTLLKATTKKEYFTGLN